MRLRTFESFWLVKNGLLYSYPMVQKNIKTEIVVIGGGITGALISHALLDEGYGVTILDRRDIGQGSTSATTSMLQYEIDVPLFKLTKMIGEKGAVECYKAGIDAIKKLEKLILENKIDCGFGQKKSLYFSHNKSSEKELQKEFLIRKENNLGVKWLSSSEIMKRFGILSNGGILSEIAASIDAYKFTHEIIAANCKRGLKVYDQTEIQQIEHFPNSVEIKTVEGHKIKAKKIIFCNGYESTSILKEKIAQLKFTYACVSERDIKLKPSVSNTLIWNTQDPYLYLRTTDDGRFLIGGEDDNFKSNKDYQKLKEKKGQKLLEELKKVMPEINFIEDFSWGGVFGSTKDGLPYIGSSPEMPNALWVLGFGGNGITFSIQGMDIIIEMLKGENPPIAHWYRFGR